MAITFPSTPKASLVVGYRGHLNPKNKDALGMVYDHMTYQKSTNHPTVTSIQTDVQAHVTSFFRRALNQHPVALPHGVRNEEGKNIPPHLEKSYEGGLLVVPGRAAQQENEGIRQCHEFRLIREALKRGQPILGVCAGAWRVWEGANVAFEHPDWFAKNPSEFAKSLRRKETLKCAKHHNYRGGMLRLRRDGSHVGYNVQIHNVRLEEGRLLQKAMQKLNPLKPTRFSVNSVHWKVINHRIASSNLHVSAWSERNPTIHLTIAGEEMKPQENIPEAFESKYGSPIMGIQWHPEGYNRQHHPNAQLHINVLTYMAQAGDAYAAKRAMLREFADWQSRRFTSNPRSDGG